MYRMFQTRIFKGKFKNNTSYPNKFETHDFITPLIQKFRNKDINELKKEVEKLEHRLKLVCHDISKIQDGDIDHLRKLVLLLQILNKIFESSLDAVDFTFSWQEIISNLLHLENDPNLMIRSMIRELKRRNSYKARISIRNDQETKEIFKLNDNQKSILHYL